MTKNCQANIYRCCSIVFLAFVLTGCLNTENRKVVLEDDLLKEKVASKAKNLVKKTYKQKIAEKMLREKQIQISEKLYQDEKYRAEVRKEMLRLDKTIPEDPFESYEADRARVLNRKFTDTRNNISNDD
jgi:hypothetical protein